MTDRLLIAGVSALVHSNVHNQKFGTSTPLSLSKLHKSMFSSGPVSKVKTPASVKVKSEPNDDDDQEGEKTVIYMSDFTGMKVPLEISIDSTISQIKSCFCSKVNRSIDEVALVYSGIRLADPEKRLSDYNIQKHSTVHVLPVKKSVQQPNDFHLDVATLASNYNYDFRGIVADGQVYYRGGQRYERPVGYMRYAINVLDQYLGGNQWLGVKGRPSETQSAPGEWIVSYHGTTTDEFGSMSNDGYRISKSEKKDFNQGIYSTPSIKLAERFAQKFQFDGAQYLVILQNRVNPNTVEKLGNGTYYLSPNENDVIPYGICIKKI
ncbi:ubiquitin domain-containing protein [Heterostelium album PN500]|uniref:Ubiquitin domain-containing protein n=1 Tax=Heterostelium pallidum (strain ATCC 26659 / Pp 5 / PN500) TaxID=670386 RepID=D3AW10_HETP5|nr:ubiquitin domain-containing protein [Heterostelium album PN500]EFA86483.1 ubiquitin domain-containing protein [Heterostelium album PN500]|eukprot:XP_020438588.1 ubiquitin domain-containing protein [Heterostelium album PN500]